MSRQDFWHNNLMDYFKDPENNSYNHIRHSLKTRLEKFGFCYLGEGRHRCVFLAPCATKVYKFPIGRSGISANHREANNWRRKLKDEADLVRFEFARCKLLGDTDILIQEYLYDVRFHHWKQQLRDDPELPRWALQWECAQIGQNKHGEWVLYDYADYDEYWDEDDDFSV